MIHALTRLPLRLAMRALYAVLRLRWFIARPATRGAHAIALTPERRVVLVKLRYVGGWRLPGGGIEPGEDAPAAALRELREEIGMSRHGPVQPAFQSDQRINHRSDRSAIFIVRDVAYAPRWSWEVEAVTEAPLDALPPGTSNQTRAWLARAASMVADA